MVFVVQSFQYLLYSVIHQILLIVSASIEQDIDILRGVRTACMLHRKHAEVSECCNEVASCTICSKHNIMTLHEARMQLDNPKTGGFSKLTA